MNNLNYGTGDVVETTRSFADTAMNYVIEWAPRVLAALVILLIGYIIARAVKWAIASMINRTPIARRANRPGVGARHPSTIGAQLGDAGYWIVLLVAIFMAAQPLGLAAATGPVGQMLNGFFAAVPRIVGAGLTFFVGYIVASVLKKAVEAVVTASHVERFTTAVGGTASETSHVTIGRAIGSIVFALVIIPVTIAALGILDIPAITQPATAMLQLVLNAIPRIVAAAIILTVAYFVGRFASRLLTQSLQSVGFDRTVSSLGLFQSSSTTVSTSTGTTSVTPSRAAGSLAFAFIVIFGLMEAFRQLDFAYGSQLIEEVLSLFGRVVFGAAIIAAAVAIARFVAQAMSSSGEMTTTVVRYGIIILGVAMGLQAMGFAGNIINLAFGLILGAFAVAAALAFGLGGRQAAGRIVERVANQMEAEANKPTLPSSGTTTASTTGSTMTSSGGATTPTDTTY